MMTRAPRSNYGDCILFRDGPPCTQAWRDLGNLIAAEADVGEDRSRDRDPCSHHIVRPREETVAQVGQRGLRYIVAAVMHDREGSHAQVHAFHDGLQLPP